MNGSEIESSDTSSRLMRLPEILELTATSHVTLWRWVRDGKFPAPIAQWPGKSLVWRRREIEEFLGLEVA